MRFRRLLLLTVPSCPLRELAIDGVNDDFKSVSDRIAALVRSFAVSKVIGQERKWPVGRVVFIKYQCFHKCGVGVALDQFCFGCPVPPFHAVWPRHPSMVRHTLWQRIKPSSVWFRFVANMIHGKLVRFIFASTAPLAPLEVRQLGCKIGICASQVCFVKIASHPPDKKLVEPPTDERVPRSRPYLGRASRHRVVHTMPLERHPRHATGSVPGTRYVACAL